MLGFFLGGEVDDILVVKINNAIGHLTVRSLDESELVDSGVDAERRDQTDVRAFRALNRAEASVVSVVNVTNLETGTLTRQTARTQSRQTTLVSDLCQRVGLVHELRQWVGSEERVDDARNGLGIDEVGGGEHLIIANVHALTNSTAHTCQTDGELIRELFANGAYATVRQVVDIVDGCIRVHQLNQVFDNLDDIVLRQYADVHIGIETQFLINTVAAHFAQVVALVGEEEVHEHFLRAVIVGRISIAQLTIDVEHSLLLGVARVLGECVEDDRELAGHLGILVEQH